MSDHEQTRLLRRDDPNTTGTIRKWLLWIITALALSLAMPVAAQDGLPPAFIANDEGGVAIVHGELNYSDPYLSTLGDQPLVFLGNMNGLYTREFQFSTEYLDVDAPQVLGAITSDIAESPFSFEVHLPIDPGGALFDVDNDVFDDQGVGIYSVNFTFNGLGNQYIDSREFIYFRSYERSADYTTFFDVVGGKVLVYAPDGAQGFPAGHGRDHVLFTADDPIVSVPAGWTVVDISTDPFTFDRSHLATVDILESEGEAMPDFSQLSYTAAFDAMVTLLRDHYAYTEQKAINWDETAAAFRPQIVEAEAAQDSEAYQLALQAFVQSIPDENFDIQSPYLDELPMVSDMRGGIGLAIRELSDRRIIVTYVVEESPAAEAGIQLGAEVIAINGLPAGDAVSAEPGLNPPHSNGSLKRLQQLRDAMRFEIGQNVELTYRNTGAEASETVTLTATDESESRLYSRESIYGPSLDRSLPLEYTVLDSGYGYIAIYSFGDNYDLTLSLWNRAMAAMSDVPGMIIDMRYNTWGTPVISEPMVGYFIDAPLYTRTAAIYFEDVNEFRQSDVYSTVLQPAEEAIRYHGEVVVLVSPACLATCESFAYDLSMLDNVTVIGQYPTGGLGGTVSYYTMPEDVLIQYTVQRTLNTSGEAIIEDRGVVPDVVVPVTEATLFSESDVLLDAAVAFLDEAMGPEIVDAGAIAVSDTVIGEIAPDLCMVYTLEVTEDALLTIRVSDEAAALDTILRVYDGDWNLLADNDDVEPGVNISSAIHGLHVVAGEMLIIEVATVDDAGEGAFLLKVAGE